MAKYAKAEYLNATLREWETIWLNLEAAHSIVPFHDKLNLKEELGDLDKEDYYAVVSFSKDYNVTVRGLRTDAYDDSIEKHHIEYLGVGNAE